MMLIQHSVYSDRPVNTQSMVLHADWLVLKITRTLPCHIGLGQCQWPDNDNVVWLPNA